MRKSPQLPFLPGMKPFGITFAYVGALLGAAMMNEKVEEIAVAKAPITVRTTAYTHSETDHLGYGKKTAIGTILQSGKVNSAAADWSVFPVGTKFRIVGDDTVYEVDDYGSALVGTETIDIYRPSRGSMNHWGVRHVDIEIVEEGCVEISIAVLEGLTAWRHCREMLERLRDRDKA